MKKIKKYKTNVERLKKYLNSRTEVYKTFKEFLKFFVYFGEVLDELDIEFKKIKKKKPPS